MGTFYMSSEGTLCMIAEGTVRMSAEGTVRMSAEGTQVSPLQVFSYLQSVLEMMRIANVTEQSMLCEILWRTGVVVSVLRTYVLEQSDVSFTQGQTSTVQLFLSPPTQTLTKGSFSYA